LTGALPAVPTAETPEAPPPGLCFAPAMPTTRHLHPVALQTMGPLHMPEVRMPRQSLLPLHLQVEIGPVPQVKLLERAKLVSTDESRLTTATKMPVRTGFMGNS
jgi:hypothetical protein